MVGVDQTVVMKLHQIAARMDSTLTHHLSGIVKLVVLSIATALDLQFLMKITQKLHRGATSTPSPKAREKVMAGLPTLKRISILERAQET
jgi:hypothetical protein